MEQFLAIIGYRKMKNHGYSGKDGEFSVTIIRWIRKDDDVIMSFANPRAATIRSFLFLHSELVSGFMAYPPNEKQCGLKEQVMDAETSST